MKVEHGQTHKAGGDPIGYYDRGDTEYAWEDPPTPEVEVTDNPIIAILLDAKGEVLKQWAQRPPIGFR